MNQPDNRPVRAPADVPRPDAPRPGATGTDLQGPDTERLLTTVEGDLASVDDLSTQDQVPVFDAIHTALADALARTADTGGSPAGGHQGA
jgi:hypothetical protein